MKDRKSVKTVGVVAAVAVVIIGLFFSAVGIVKMFMSWFETVNYEVEGYNIALVLRVPESKFRYEVKKDKHPRYPSFEIRDNRGDFLIKGVILEVSERAKADSIAIAKSKSHFLSEKVNEKNDELKWFSHGTKKGRRVMVMLEKRERLWYVLSVEIEGLKNKRDDWGELIWEDPMDRSEIKNIIKSIRVRKDYQAPKLAYQAPNNDTFRVKLLNNEIDGYKIKQENWDRPSVIIEAEKDRRKFNIVIIARSSRQNIGEILERDILVKHGKEKYLAVKQNLRGVEMRETKVIDGVDGLRKIKAYVAKDGGIVQLIISFEKEDELVSRKLMEQVVENLTIDEERMKKFYH